MSPSISSPSFASTPSSAVAAPAADTSDPEGERRKFDQAAAVAAQLQAQLAQTLQEVTADEEKDFGDLAPSEMLKLDVQTKALSLQSEVLSSMVRADKDIVQAITNEMVD